MCYISLSKEHESKSKSSKNISYFMQSGHEFSHIEIVLTED